MRAFAPGSVTAIFAPAGSGDESMGASFTVADGITADVRPAENAPRVESPVVLDGEPTDFAPVEIALRQLGLSEEARVALTAEIPIGRGFGASGAATLATALAANAEFDLDRTREQLVEVAHRAEVEAGTGLGDVFVQQMGGLVLGDGTTRWRFDRDDPIEYASFGSIATEDALADDDLMARIDREGTAALDALPDEPSMADVTREGWTFAQAIDLPTEEVREAVADVESAGGVASMAMVGETVFGVGAEGVLANRTAVSPNGARLIDG